MKKALSTRSLLAFAGILSTLFFGLSSCKTSQQKQEVTKGDIGEEPEKEAVIQDLSGYPIPTAFEITDLIHKAGAPYILTLSNDPDKAGDYIRQKDKALNLGIYGTDLCYASSYMMKQGTMLYLEATKILIDELGIATNFNTGYVQRVENNLDNRDSLIFIVTDSFYDTWDYLVENKEDVLARLVVSGSWIEGIYITTNIAKTSKDPSAIMEILAEQKNSLNKLVKLLEPVKEVDDVEEVFKGLYDLHNIYKGVGNRLTDEQLDQISARIESLREAIV